MLQGGILQPEAKKSKFLEVREIGINFHADFLVKTLLDIALAFHMNTLHPAVSMQLNMSRLSNMKSNQIISTEARSLPSSFSPAPAEHISRNPVDYPDHYQTTSRSSQPASTALSTREL